MRTRPLAPEWLSAHVHLTHPIYSVGYDQVLRDVVRPFVSRCRRGGWINRFFFVRYSQGGPHVRLRVRGAADVLASTVRPAFEEFVATLPASVRSLHDVRVSWVPYEPETDRYGGASAIDVAEEFFHSSSVAAFQFIDLLDADEQRKHRLGLALAAKVVLTQAIHDSDVRQGALFLGHYARAYERVWHREAGPSGAWSREVKERFDEQSSVVRDIVSGAWSGAASTAVLDEPLASYSRACRAVVRQLGILHDMGRLWGSSSDSRAWKVGRVAMSLMHMTSNRIGVSPLEEAYLAHLASAAMSSGLFREPQPSGQ